MVEWKEKEEWKISVENKCGVETKWRKKWIEEVVEFSHTTNARRSRESFRTQGKPVEWNISVSDFVSVTLAEQCLEVVTMSALSTMSRTPTSTTATA